MPFKPNYRLERAARTRKQEERKLEKLEARAARRKAKSGEAPAEGDSTNEIAEKPV